MSDVGDLTRRALAGERRALARLLTLVEDGPPAVQREIVRTLHPRSGRARLVGVTGSPGVGKSSVTSAVITMLRTRGRSAAVLAVDPSSPLTGGALLGDRIRMQEHHGDEGVFVRSIAARGHLGGLAAAVPAAALCLDAAGFDTVLIETVGVGQSEVDVAAMADTTLVVLAPGLGDSVQAAKAGILEVADVLVVNKADQSGAGRLEAELRGMLDLGREIAGGAAPTWVPPIVRTVAVRGEGIDALLDEIERHGDALAGDRSEVRARARARRWIVELAAGRVRDRLVAPDGPFDGLLGQLAEEVVARMTDPIAAAERLVAELG